MPIKFEEAENKFSDVHSFLKQELGAMRAGRATPQLIENIKIDAYGQKMPLNQVANITIVDASLITVKPWDKSNLQPIAKAIDESDTGLKSILEGDFVKLPVPSLTEERRKEYVKIMKEKIEEARIAVRQVRKEVLDSMEADKEKKLITEDDFTRLEKELQKLVDDINGKIETSAVEKEKELMEV